MLKWEKNLVDSKLIITLPTLITKEIEIKN